MSRAPQSERGADDRFSSSALPRARWTTSRCSRARLRRFHAAGIQATLQSRRIAYPKAYSVLSLVLTKTLLAPEDKPPECENELMVLPLLHSSLPVDASSA